MFRFCALLTAMLHDRTALPSTITVQQPHCERPQPNFGPFSPSSPRNTYNSGVLGSVSTTRGLPFTFSDILAMTRSLNCFETWVHLRSSKSARQQIPICHDRF